LKIRRDAVTVSSILFTLALLIPAPAMLWNACTARQTLLRVAGRLLVENYYAPTGFASLAVIVIGLITTWAGYIKGVRWTWFVMFLIAWGWAFPVLVLAEFHWRNMMPIAQWPPPAPTGRGPQLGFTGSLLTFLLMVLALLVPVKTFVLGNRGSSRG
jgi:energy-coupling factor transporter transmembrane protein EcfT